MKIKRDKVKIALYIFLISFLPVLLVWLPFILHLKRLFYLNLKSGGFLNIIRNWDGPHYLVIAKTWYDPTKIVGLIFTKSADYYPAHFPLFPFFIYLFHFFTGWLKAGVVVNLFFGFLLNIIFYLFVKSRTKYPLFLTFVFTVFPARFLVVRSISAPETLMLFFMLLSLYFFERKKIFYSSFFAALAVLTKIQAIFLFIAYLVEGGRRVYKKERIDLFYLWIFLIPSALLLLFVFYSWRTGNFFAFFSAEKGNNLFMNFPFSQFNYASRWGGAWLEDVVFYFLAMVILVIRLADSRHKEWFYFALFYTLFLIITPQRDITRFSYPLLPLFLVQFEKFFTSKLFKLGLLFSLPAIYFYTVNFILVNQAPVANWTLFIK